MGEKSGRTSTARIAAARWSQVTKRKAMSDAGGTPIQPRYEINVIAPVCKRLRNTEDGHRMREETHQDVVRKHRISKVLRRDGFGFFVPGSNSGGDYGTIVSKYN